MNIPLPPAFVRERKFDSKIKVLTTGYRRMHEFDEAIEWALSRNPTQFYNIEGDFYVWKTDSTFIQFPQLRILYKYDLQSNTITLIDLEEVKD
jgi:hypothetical protein